MEARFATGGCEGELVSEERSRSEELGRTLRAAQPDEGVWGSPEGVGEEASEGDVVEEEDEDDDVDDDEEEEEEEG